MVVAELAARQAREDDLIILLQQAHDAVGGGRAQRGRHPRRRCGLRGVGGAAHPGTQVRVRPVSTVPLRMPRRHRVP